MAEAVYDINRYLANDVDMQTLLNATAANFPIYPLYEPPERTVPYIIYTVRTKAENKQYWLFRDKVYYIIYSDSVKASGDIQMRMIQLLGKQGDAFEVPNVGSTDGFCLKETKLIGTNLYPPKEEGGLHERHVVFEYCYTWTGVE